MPKRESRLKLGSVIEPHQSPVQESARLIAIIMHHQSKRHHQLRKQTNQIRINRHELQSHRRYLVSLDNFEGMIIFC